MGKRCTVRGGEAVDVVLTLFDFSVRGRVVTVWSRGESLEDAQGHTIKQDHVVENVFPVVVDGVGGQVASHVGFELRPRRENALVHLEDLRPDNGLVVVDAA